jgi:hypothetical protein
MLESKTIANMPLHARQYVDPALVTPGVLPSAAGAQGGGFNVSGARSQSNVFLLDGVSNIDTQVNSALGNFRITDAVQEFAVQTSVPTAEFGEAGGQVSVTESGSMNFRPAFEFLRNARAGLSRLLHESARSKKTPLHRNQYGATFSGPIKRTRRLFASWEGPSSCAHARRACPARARIDHGPISKALLQFWPAANAQRVGQTNNSQVQHQRFDNTYSKGRPEFQRQRSPQRRVGRVSRQNVYTWRIAGYGRQCERAR